MIERSERGYFTSSDPHRFFTRERDAINHHKFLVMREQIAAPLRDERKLDELVTIWYRMYGKTLRDHVRLRRLLYRMSVRMNNPVAQRLTSEQFSIYREERTKEVTTTTANREHSYLRAMFNELNRLGVIAYENPVAKIRQFREREGELRYLTFEEQASLLNSSKHSSNASLLYVVKICLATGARWSEAESLKAGQVASNKITFLDTKSGKNRTVPINDILFSELSGIGKTGNEKLFVSCLSAFRKAITKAKITLPRGQMSHALRHSFASHFVMQGGNIVILKEILGHSEITTTMRYAHFAPNHLNDAVKLNPLNQHQ